MCLAGTGALTVTSPPATAGFCSGREGDRTSASDVPHRYGNTLGVIIRIPFISDRVESFDVFGRSFLIFEELGVL